MDYRCRVSPLLEGRILITNSEVPTSVRDVM